MIIPELPDYITSLGGADYKGLIISMFAMAALISRPFSGKLTDTIGRIPVMIVGAVVCFIIGFIYPLWQTLGGFLFLRFMHGFSAGFKPTGTTAYLADIIPLSKRGEALGMIGMFGSVGMAGGNAIGGWMGLHYPLETLFHTSSFVAIFSILVLAGMKETLPNKQAMKLSFLKISFKDVFEPKVLAPFVVMTLTVVAFGAILTIIPDFSRHLGVENKGLFMAVLTIASIAVRFAAGKASDRYGRVNVLKVSSFGIAMSMFMLGFVSNSTEFLTVAVFFGLAVGMNSPAIFAWTIDLADDKHRGRAMSTVFIALELGIVIGGLLSGWLYGNNADNFSITFFGCGVFALVAFIYLIVKHPRYAKRKD